MRQRLTWKRNADVESGDFVYAQRTFGEAFEALQWLEKQALLTARDMENTAVLAEHDSANIGEDIEELAASMKRWGQKAQEISKKFEETGKQLQTLKKMV